MCCWSMPCALDNSAIEVVSLQLMIMLVKSEVTDILFMHL